MDFSKLLHRFVKIDKGGINGFIEVVTWICQNCYVDLLKFLCAYWSFCFELKVLNGSKYSMP